MAFKGTRKVHLNWTTQLRKPAQTNQVVPVRLSLVFSRASLTPGGQWHDAVTSEAMPVDNFNLLIQQAQMMI